MKSPFYGSINRTSATPKRATAIFVSSANNLKKMSLDACFPIAQFGFLALDSLSRIRWIHKTPCEDISCSDVWQTLDCAVRFSRRHVK